VSQIVLPKSQRRATERSTAKLHPAAAKAHTVTRYRLRLIKEDEEPIAEPEILAQPKEIAAFLWKRVFDGLDREVMCVVYVDNCHRVIGWTVAYVGCLSRCNVEPRGLVVPALLANSSGLAIAHNHPAGSAQPSEEDWSCPDSVDSLGLSRFCLPEAIAFPPFRRRRGRRLWKTRSVFQGLWEGAGGRMGEAAFHNPAGRRPG
jgi:RadC-like JAB domain